MWAKFGYIFKNSRIYKSGKIVYSRQQVKNEYDKGVRISFNTGILTLFLFFQQRNKKGERRKTPW